MGILWKGITEASPLQNSVTDLSESRQETDVTLKRVTGDTLLQGLLAEERTG